MTEPTFEYIPLCSLKPYERNARTHTKKQIKQIARSIRDLGFRAVLIDADDRIIAGHARVEAAKVAGLTSTSSSLPGHDRNADPRLHYRGQQACREGWLELG